MSIKKFKFLMIIFFSFLLVANFTACDIDEFEDAPQHELSGEVLDSPDTPLADHEYEEITILIEGEEEDKTVETFESDGSWSVEVEGSVDVKAASDEHDFHPAEYREIDESKDDLIFYASEVNARFPAGEGTEEDPYLIASASNFDSIRAFRGESFKQIRDIDMQTLDEESWDPIGDDIRDFEGEFDGNDYVIKNLVIEGGNDFKGLFRKLDDSSAKLENIQLKNVDVSGDNYIGGLVGHLDTGKIIDSSVSGSVEGQKNVGGLAGVNDDIIEDSFSETRVTGQENIGGLAGYNAEGDILKSYTTANSEIEVSEKIAGGFVGLNEGLIEKSFSAGEVSGGENFGGLVGRNDGDISNCYVRGDVSGKNIGGLVFYNTGNIDRTYSAGNVEFTGEEWLSGGLVARAEGTVSHSFFNKETTNIETGPGEAISTEEMKQQETFMPDWDFDVIWDIEEGESYPYLEWQENNIPYPAE